MTTTTPLALNDGQNAAADGFFQFLFDKTPELIISGPGGVGKTFLMGNLIDEIIPRYHTMCKLTGIDSQYNEVAMTSTTNKAAEVLSVATGRPTQTIHSFLGLKVKDNYKTGKSELVKTTSWTIHHNKIIFVDEASMIDNDLLTLLRESTCNCKIVFVGDHCQLSPIQEAISPIYRQRLPFYELTEQMRTGIPELQAVNLQLRRTVETGEFQPIKIHPGIIDHLSPDQMENEINTIFANDANARILAYTNQRVVAYNDHIRQIRNLPPTYTLGETLINNTAIPAPGGFISVEAEVKIVEMDLVTEEYAIDEDEGVFLTVRYVTLEDSYGGRYNRIPIPEDREHFNALVKYYQRLKKWFFYYKLKNTFPDLRPREAATVHKAQGSTYDTVFVDVGNLSTCHNPNQAARLLYVAFSRARSRVVLYGELADKYGGLIY